MKAKVAQLFAKLDKMSTRERVLIYVAAGAIVLFLADQMFLSGLAAQRAAVAGTINEQRAEIARISGEIDAAQSALSQDPDAPIKLRIRQMDEKAAAIDRELQGIDRQLVPPERVGALLEEMLRENRKLRLVRMKTLPVKALIDREKLRADTAASVESAAGDPASVDAAAAAAPSPPAKPVDDRAGITRLLADYNIFRHGIEISFRGSYLDILDYLVKLEALPVKMYWSGLRLDSVDANGRDGITATLTVNTLSLDRAWIKL